MVLVGKRLVLALALLVCGGSAIKAGSTTVTDEASLKAAIASGARGITLAADILLSDQITVNESTAGLVIDGQSRFKLDGQGACHVFEVTGGSLAVRNLEVTGGFSGTSNGGGFLVSGGDVTIDNCGLVGNAAPNGLGGAVCMKGLGTLSMTNTTVSGNTGNYGGGVYTSSSFATIVDCTFTGNTAAAYGGALRISGGQVSVADAAFTGNAAAGFSSSGGGAVQVTSGTVSLTDVAFTDNEAAATGGALLVTSEWPVVALAGFSFTQNAAGSGEDPLAGQDVFFSTAPRAAFYSSCGEQTFDSGGAAVLGCAYHASSGNAACGGAYEGLPAATTGACDPCPEDAPFSCAGGVGAGSCSAEAPECA